jgi:hypothetical protein
MELSAQSAEFATPNCLKPRIFVVWQKKGAMIGVTESRCVLRIMMLSTVISFASSQVLALLNANQELSEAILD